ncbi:S-adenosyl-L-methionine-dependent methyltransferase [Neoconidiobolus thromboides FSU 785]|nr:S-adenosyl-L-methionine-dependent methyltransferase [Neoconidiobolus thromboides FSU 785]
MSRPEHQGPPEHVYNELEASKYTANTRIAEIQAEMALRALELLNLPEEQPSYLLDIGCGSGLSGEILEEEGHFWVGFDISPSMLNVAVEREVEGDLFLQDAGQGLSFRPGTFDGAISISVLQWLCNADKNSHVPWKRLNHFFTTLFMCLKKGARAVFQFYPENDEQLQMIMSAAMKCGFTGGLVIDYPNSRKARKHYLCLFAGQSNDPLPQAKGMEQGELEVGYSKKRIKNHRKSKLEAKIKGKDWIMKKKESARAKGVKVAKDSKYTGRKRRPKF